MLHNNRVALVYDWFDSWGGVERILLTLSEMFPQADWYTSIFDPTRASWAKKLNPHTSYVQRMPVFIKHNRVFSTPLYPFAFEAFDFSDYKLVISITSSFAKGIITKPPTRHICYLLTPTRFLWSHEKEYRARSLASRAYIEYLKKWDRIASHRPDEYICISQTVQRRLQLLYDRTGVVIYPPFDIEYWKTMKEQTNSPFSTLPSPFFLLVSRLEPYKKIDLAIQAFNQLSDLHLIIVGNGTRKHTLVGQAGKNITFLHNISDTELAGLYSQAQALIMPQEEDFGMTALEAQFFGCPVIAYKKGGAMETVREEKTGIFFDEQNVHSLTSALEKFEGEAYNLHESTKKHGPENVKGFSRETYEKKFRAIVDKYV